LNNRELLIKILIRLRGNGITNERLLNVVEQMPPHYFISILRKYKPLEQVSLDEVVNIVKIFQFLLKDLKKISNFFISGINSGWSVYIAAKLSKRVYCLLNNHLDKKRLEEFFKERKIDNQSLKVNSKDSSIIQLNFHNKVIVNIEANFFSSSFFQSVNVIGENGDFFGTLDGKIKVRECLNSNLRYKTITNHTMMEKQILSFLKKKEFNNNDASSFADNYFITEVLDKLKN